jgi:hypothetical protein
MTAMIQRTADTGAAHTGASTDLTLSAPTTWDSPVAPIALQRWESDGGACFPS